MRDAFSSASASTARASASAALAASSRPCSRERAISAWASARTSAVSSAASASARSRICAAALSAATSSSCAISRAWRRVATALRRRRLICFFGLPPLACFLAPDCCFDIVGPRLRNRVPPGAHLRGEIRAGRHHPARAYAPAAAVNRGRVPREGPADDSRPPRTGRVGLRRSRPLVVDEPDQPASPWPALTGARLGELARAQACGLERARGRTRASGSPWSARTRRACSPRSSASAPTAACSCRSTSA